MTKLALGLFLLFLLILIYKSQLASVIDGFLNLQSSCDNSDGRCYKVSKEFDEHTRDEAGEYLAKINKKIMSLLKFLRHKYFWDEHMHRTQNEKYKKKLVSRLLSLYDPGNVIENAPKTTVNTSYVEDKGRVFAMCLREKESGKHLFEDEDVMVFVFLHELSHIASEAYGHGTDFWRDFKIILQEAIEAGIYHPVDYSKNPVKYCGVNISYSPLYDKSL